MPVDLNKYVIELALRGRFGRPFKYLDEVGSTNAEALEWSREGAPHGAMVVTDHQTEGRGRHGRAWFSQPGTALQLSLILRPVVPLDVFGLISTALGLACAEAIEELTQLPVTLKWPNDVTVEGRKLAGILVETRVGGHQVDVAVAGIGINVSPPEDWPPGVAATTIGGELSRVGRDPVVDRAELLAGLLERIESVYVSVETGRGAADVLRRATQRSAILGDEVVVSRPDGTTVTGVATRLLPSGALEVHTGGSYLSLQVGEIEHLRPTSVPPTPEGPNDTPDSSTVER
ncbi:MAG TPA: biotin--[acetyl-CoA-carboxylase] ligase [Actinomycetota bacterium]|nr:biotin--[acetyl-CoA-carboxylase] ligase [Actinomycetota bacterium]